MNVLKKSRIGRITVGIVITVVIAVSSYVVFKSFGQTLYGQPPDELLSGTESRATPTDSGTSLYWCLEKAIYLQDRLDISISHSLSTTGILVEGVGNNRFPRPEEFAQKLRETKKICVGSRPNPTNRIHRMFQLIEEQYAAYSAWRATVSPLRATLVRDTFSLLAETTIQ